MLMSGLQFTSQILMAHAVLQSGIVKRKKPAALTWHQYFIQGAAPPAPSSPCFATSPPKMLMLMHRAAVSSSAARAGLVWPALIPREHNPATLH